MKQSRVGALEALAAKAGTTLESEYRRMREEVESTAVDLDFARRALTDHTQEAHPEAGLQPNDRPKVGRKGLA